MTHGLSHQLRKPGRNAERSGFEIFGEVLPLPDRGDLHGSTAKRCLLFQVSAVSASSVRPPSPSKRLCISQDRNDSHDFPNIWHALLPLKLAMI